MVASLAALKAAVPCREEQIDLLASLLGESGCQLPPCLFVYGDSGSGKSTVLEAVLGASDLLSCSANCVELYSPQLLFQTVINAFADWTPSSANQYSPFAACDNLGEFVRQLQLLAEGSCSGRRLAMVLYQSERLRDAEAHLLPALSRLQELSGLNLTVLLVSALPLDRLLPTSAMVAPIVMHFPQYNKEELLTLLLRDQASYVDVASTERVFREDFHRTFISLVLSVFYPATRSITEMSHLLSVHWVPYTAPVLRGEVVEEDMRRLWRNIEPHLRKSLETVYLREVTSAQFEEMQRLAEQSSNSLPTIQTLSGAAAKVELPFYSKYLLIAAYLASYNPTRTDRRFFVKHHGKQKKTLASIKAKERSSSQLTGPKLFPLDRLLAIFYSISECRSAPTAALLTQLSTLVSLRLLVQCGGDDQLDAPKVQVRSQPALHPLHRQNRGLRHRALPLRLFLSGLPLCCRGTSWLHKVINGI